MAKACACHILVKTSEEAENLKQVLLQEMPEADILIGDLSSSLAVHAGEGTLAFQWRREVS